MTELERIRQEFAARMLAQGGPKPSPQMSPVPDQQGQMSPENMAVLRGQAAYDPGKREAILADQLRSGRDQVFAQGPQGKQMGNVYAAPTWSENLSGAVKKGLGGLEMATARKGLGEVDDLRGVAADATGQLGEIAQAKADAQLATENQNKDAVLSLATQKEDRESKEYAEWTDGETILKGYKQGGIGYDVNGDKIPAGFSEKQVATRSSGSQFQPITKSDEYGNIIVTTFDKATGDMGEPTFTNGDVYTPEEAKKRGDRAATQKGSESFEAAAGSKRVEKADAARSTVAALGKVNQGLASVDEALNDGAYTGKVAALLPTLRASTVELQNVRDRMALDQIGEHTFGSLSEAEGDWLKSTSVPDLPETELRAWTKKRVEANKRIMNAASYEEEMYRNNLDPDPEIVSQIKYSGGFTFED